MISARPPVEAILLAIKYIEDRSCTYTCIALIQACNVLHVKLDDITELKDQYRRFSFNRAGDNLPVWWDRPYSPTYKFKRIQNLKAFYNACLEAGKRENAQTNSHS